MTKQELRAAMRQQRKNREAREKESPLLCRHVVESRIFQKAMTIGGYIPLAHEADIRSILQEALQQGKQLALPLCQQRPVMTMRFVSSLTGLHAGSNGVLEPSEDAPIIPPEEIDLLLVPLEGIDRCGYRLGKGGGFYDHYLTHTNATTIGCALSWQWTDDVPHDVWDVQLHACADHDGIHWFNKLDLK